MRSVPFETPEIMVWDVDNPDEYMYDWEGTNNWVESSLNYYLNNDFYKNLNSDAKKYDR